LNMATTPLFIIGHMLHAFFIGALLVHSYRAANVWHFHLFVGFAVLFAVEFEIYHEMCRLVGLIGGGPDATLRVRYLFCVYFVLGFFYREVIYYAEEKR